MKNLKNILFVILLIFSSASITKAQSQELETVIQRGHQGAVKVAVFSPDGKFLITGGRDKTAKLWEVSTGREMRSFIGHSGTVQALCFSPDGSLIATGSADKSVKLWKVATGDLIRTFEDDNIITSIAFTSDAKHIIIGGYERVRDKTAKIFIIETGKLLRKFKVSPNIGTGTGVKIDISKDNKNILVSEDNRKVVIYDFETGEKKITYKSVEKGSCGGCGTFAKYSPDEKYIISASRNGPLVLWDTEKIKKVKTFIEKQEDVTSVDISSDGTMVLTSDDNSIYVYNTKNGRRIKTIKAHEKDVNYVEFSPDGKHIISASDDGSAVLWKISTGKKVKTFIGFLNNSDYGTKLDREEYWERWARTYFDYKTSVKISTDGKLMILGKKDSIAKVLEVETGRTAYNLIGHSGAVICFDFSPDGKYIATGSSDKTVKLWNTENGKLIKTLKGHWEMVFSVHFDKTGKKLLTSGWDGDAYIWNIETGEKELPTGSIAQVLEIVNNQILLVTQVLY